MLGLLLRVALLLALAAWALRRLGAGGAGAPLAAAARWWRRLAVEAVAPPRAADGDADPYQVLGVAPGASDEEIRGAYQRQMQSYHPDQVAHLGEELREVAERRSKEITAAYARLRRRGRA